MTSAPLTKKITNNSTEDDFQFFFHCDRCGAGVPSEKYIFSAEHFDPPLRGLARTLLWTRRHDEAYERANDEARFEFNLCPICGRRVCDNCFHVSSEAVTDICLDCKQSLERPPHQNLQQQPPRRKLFPFRRPVLRSSGGCDEHVSPCHPAV